MSHIQKNSKVLPLEEYVVLSPAFMQCACMGRYEMGGRLTLSWFIWPVNARLTILLFRMVEDRFG